MQFYNKKSPGGKTINFSFKMFKIMKFLRSSKCLIATVELTFAKQKANA